MLKIIPQLWYYCKLSDLFSLYFQIFHKIRLKMTGNGAQHLQATKWDLGKRSQGGSTWSSPDETPRALWTHLKAVSQSVKGFLKTRFTRQRKVPPVSHLAEVPMISPHSRLLRLTELEASEFMNSQSHSQHTLSCWGHVELFRVLQTSPRSDCGLLPVPPATPRTAVSCLMCYRSFSRVSLSMESVGMQWLQLRQGVAVQLQAPVCSQIKVISRGRGRTKCYLGQITLAKC